MSIHRPESIALARVPLLALVAITLFVGCETAGVQDGSAEEEAAYDPTMAVQDSESPEDPVIEVATGTPLDCEENDERQACQVTTRGGGLPGQDRESMVEEMPAA